MTAKQKKAQGLVPRLRFPEFRDAAEWEAMRISDVASIAQGGTPNTNTAANWGGSIQWITPAEMNNSSKPYISETTRTLTEEGLRNCSSALLPEMSVIISTRAPIGHLVVNTVPMAFNQGCRGLIAKEQFDTKFLYYTLLRNKTILKDLGAGSTFKEITGKTLGALIVGVPTSQEQQKIADCLTSLDDLITAHTEQLEALKERKKGLLQNLFPREGERVPRLRFPEFRDAGDWGLSTLGNLGYFMGGGTPSRSVEAYWKGTIPWVSSSDVPENDVRSIAVTRFINEEAVRGSATKLVPPNSVLFVSRVGTGKLAVNVDAVCTSQDFTSFVPREACNLFVAYTFLSRKTELTHLGQGTSIKGFTGSDLAKLWVSIPSRVEQQKIADCLSSLDDTIDQLSLVIEGLKNHKKALMQQLFPSV